MQMRVSRVGRALGIVAVWLLCGLLPAFADPNELAGPELLPSPDPASSSLASPGLTIQDCIQVALAHQPAIAADRASLASVLTSYQALMDTGCIAQLLAPDLEYRQQQAQIGIAAAEARLSQTHWDVIYAVTRSYYTVVYAQRQSEVATQVVGNLKFYLQAVRDLVEAGARDLSEDNVDQLVIYLSLAETRLGEAKAGVDRATAALREAMGVGPEFPITIPQQMLPEMQIELVEEQVVALALERRGEVIQAGLATNVFRLEVSAQGAVRLRPKVPTFASGADIHAIPVPGVDRGTEYRPGGIPPEMPTTMFGSREERVEKATALSHRANASFEKTCGLVALEARNGFYRWREATERVDLTRDAAEAGRALSKRSRDLVELDSPTKDIVTNEVIAGQAQSAHNEALYQQVLMLADLERITAGGVRAAWPAPLPLPEPKSNGNGNGLLNGVER